MVATQIEYEEALGRQSFERHREYKHDHPELRCLKCALLLAHHTVEEFQYCEFVLAGSGKETLVMNRPEVNRNEPCPKGDNHQWIGDDAGDSWCTKCGEPLID